METQQKNEIRKYRVTHTVTLSVDGTAVVQIFERTEPGLYNGSNPDVFNVEEISQSEETFYRLLDQDPRQRTRYFNLRKITEAAYKANLEGFTRLNQQL